METTYYCPRGCEAKEFTRSGATDTQINVPARPRCTICGRTMRTGERAYWAYQDGLREQIEREEGWHKAEEEWHAENDPE